MNLRDFKTAPIRREALEKEREISLKNAGNVLIDEQDHIHCENLVGAVSIPLGVAGPLKINASEGQKSAYIPLATTEGALVASVNRGAKAISESGGAVVHIETVGTTRGPVFEAKNLKDALELKKWVEDHMRNLQEVASSTSSHLSLLKVQIQIISKYVYIRFSYDTQDAMGMNMVTIASDRIGAYISEHTKAFMVSVAGNFDIDKKPSWLNFIEGRGRKGWAEVRIPPEVLTGTLKTTAQSMAEMVKVKCWGGSMISGSLGFNAHYANITAAFFAATGQDLAHVVEGSMGVTNAECEADGSLVFSVFLPSIMLGTVGGGTKLKTQTEARAITGASTANELAEIFVAAVLAGELSLIASLTEGTLAVAHKKLGR